MFNNVLPISEEDIYTMTKAYLHRQETSNVTGHTIVGKYCEHQVKMYITDLYRSKDVIFQVMMREVNLIVITRLKFVKKDWQTEYAFVSKI